MSALITARHDSPKRTDGAIRRELAAARLAPAILGSARANTRCGQDPRYTAFDLHIPMAGSAGDRRIR